MTRKQDDDSDGPEISRGAADRKPPDPPRDIHEAQLEDLLTHLFDGAEDCFVEARRLGHDRDTQVEVLQQGAALSKAYGQLLTLRNRHRKALKDED